MNETNHHKVIEYALVRSLTINTRRDKKNVIRILNTLKSASNFTDDWRGILLTKTQILNRYTAFLIHARDEGFFNFLFERNYFYYHFYYDIDFDKGSSKTASIRLNRVDQKKNGVEQSMNKCDYEARKEDFENLGRKRYKKFFTTINGRENFFVSYWDGIKGAVADGSNQSNCVSFLHAMGAEPIKHGEMENSREVFIGHLKKCFKEYLFLADEEDALFMLGIAMHGIMDSFTPSHMGFQVYNNQDMALHAQGDVIPFELEGAQKFDPGQYEEASDIERIKATKLAGYGSDNKNEPLRIKEWEMARIFLEICDVKINDNFSFDVSKHSQLSRSKVGDMFKAIPYGENAFIFSNYAINVVSEVLNLLYDVKNALKCDYASYLNLVKEEEEKENIIDKAISLWKDYYDDAKFTDLRTKHIRKHLYKNNNSKSDFTPRVYENIIKDTVEGTLNEIVDTTSNSWEKAAKMVNTTANIAKDTVIGTAESVMDSTKKAVIDATDMLAKTKRNVAKTAKEVLDSHDCIMNANPDLYRGPKY